MTLSTRTSLLLILAASACNFPRPPDVGDDETSNTTYQLVALEPAIANTGDTVWLEGTFGDTATVHFPGGVSQPATILGPHRASVVVPDTATAGELTVETGGATVGPLTFRRAPFALGLQPFETPLAQANGQRQRSKLATARTGHTAVIIGNSVYVLGGASDGRALDSVERAIINADGSLGAFVSLPEITLTTPRTGHASVAIGSFLYVIGGSNRGSGLTSVERATIAADGSLGPFTTISGVNLENARESAATVVAGNSLYIIGGIGSSILRSVERAPINQDGTLGSFSTVEGVTLTSPRAGHSVAVVASSLYAIGGAVNAAAVGTVERAAILGDGAIGPFEPIRDVILSTARTGHTTVLAGRTLFAIGGSNSAGALSTIEQAELTPSGSIGRFNIVDNTTLGTPRSGHASLMIRGNMHIIGGTSGAGDLTTTEWTAVSITGSPGPFSLSPTVALNTGRIGHATAIIGHYLYVLGGNTGGIGAGALNSIERALINPEGTLDPFTTVPNAILATPRTNFSVAIIDNYLYAIGGRSTLGIPLDSIERAKIGFDGSLGPFTTVAGVVLRAGSESHSSIVLNDFIYVLGGHRIPSEGAPSLERSHIEMDGSIGAFDIVPGVSLETKRYGHSNVIAGTHLYVMGGYSEDPNHTGPVNIERASVATDGSIGPLTTILEPRLVATRSGASIAKVGSDLYLIGGPQGLEGSKTVERATARPDGSLTAFSLVSDLNLTVGRAHHTSAVIDHVIFVIGGFVGTAYASREVEQTTHTRN